MPRAYGRRLPLWGDEIDDDRERLVSWERRQRDAAARRARNVEEGLAHQAWLLQYLSAGWGCW